MQVSVAMKQWLCSFITRIISYHRHHHHRQHHITWGPAAKNIVNTELSNNQITQVNRQFSSFGSPLQPCPFHNNKQKHSSINNRNAFIKSFPCVSQYCFIYFECTLYFCSNSAAHISNRSSLENNTKCFLNRSIFVCVLILLHCNSNSNLLLDEHTAAVIDHTTDQSHDDDDALKS